VKPYGSTVARITQLLEQYGPMTRDELCNHLDVNRMNVSAVVSRMVRPGTNTPRRLHISGYTHDSETGRCYPRAIYDLGDKPDAKKLNRQENRRQARKRSDQRRAVHNTMNFVFNLAKPRRLYEH
jgi:predicted ArsR family transcriptional regulator